MTFGSFSQEESKRRRHTDVIANEAKQRLNKKKLLLVNESAFMVYGLIMQTFQVPPQADLGFLIVFAFIEPTIH
jgi:hypothetical protein